MNAKRVDKLLLHFLESHIWPIPECGCWLWDEDESKPVNFDNLPVHVDELIYQIYRGPVPENYVVVHTCQIGCCLNPEHLSISKGTVHIRPFDTEGSEYRGLASSRS